MLDGILKTAEKKQPDTDCHQRRFLVYQCYRSCGGLGDRQKGIVSAYLLAVLTGRTLFVDVQFPCKIDFFLQPNEYNWQRCKTFISKVAQRDKITFATIDKRDVYEKIFTQSDIRSTWTATVVSLTINWYALKIIRHYLNITSKPELEWIRYTRDENVVRNVLKLLFRPSAAIHKTVNTFLDVNVGNRTLVCSHIRVGRNPSLPNDEDFGRSRGHPDEIKLFNFLSVYKSKAFVLYIATDSEHLRKQSSKYFGNFITLNKTILHIDRLNVNNALGCVGFYNAITEQLLLTRCDVLLLTMSNFGTIAGLMRDKVNGLYTYLTKNNSIVSVSPWKLFEMYDME